MRVPSYRRHSSGQARVTINGKDHLLGPFGSAQSKEKYGRLIAEFSASAQSPTFGKSSQELKLDLVILAYLRYANEYYGESTELVNIKLALRPLGEIYASFPACDFGPEQYKAVRAKWLEDGSRSRQYVNKQMGRLKRFIKWAIGEGHIPAERLTAIQCVPPLKKGRTAIKEAKKVEPVDPALVELTLPHLTPVIADMVRFQQLTGCRPGELVRVTPSMLDRTGDVWLIDFEKHKTAYRGRIRTVYVGPKAQAVLAKYLFQDANKPCFSPRESEEQRHAARSAARVTPANQGNRAGYSRRVRLARKPRKEPGEAFTTQSYGKAIKYACERAKLKHWSPNQLRHAAATEIRKQFGLEGSQVILGHKDVAVTQVYAEADRKKAIEVAAMIG